MKKGNRGDMSKREHGEYQMREGFEMDEIVNGVGLDDELIGGLQPNGGPEVAEAEGDGAAVVNVAGVAQQPHPGIRPVLDYRRRRR